MTLEITVGERTRTAVVVGDADGPAGRALVLVFHGSKQSGAVHRRFTGGALDRLAASRRAVIVYLDGHRGNWNDARASSGFPARREGVDDVAFARAVVDSLAASHGIDRTTVVGVGYSNGGQMVFRLLHEAEGLLSAAVVVAATMPEAADFTAGFSTTAAHPVPVVVVAGTADRIVPFDGGRMAWWARALFRVDGVALSAPATAEYFARRNGVALPPTTLSQDPGRDMSGRPPTETIEYRQEGRPPVTLHIVRGGGHTVPGATTAPRVLGRTGARPGIDEIVDGLLRTPSRG